MKLGNFIELITTYNLELEWLVEKVTEITMGYRHRVANATSVETTV